MLEELSDFKESEHIAENIIQSLEKPFPIRNEMITIGVSIGIGYSTTGTEEVVDLVRAADQAMYEAKRQGKNRCCVYKYVA